MARLTPIAVSAAAALSMLVLTAGPVQATALGAATNVRLADQTVSPVTNVTWWGHRRFHHRGFFFHRHHPRFVILHRHRHCRWC